jgi:hypothetical protein
MRFLNQADSTLVVLLPPAPSALLSLGTVPETVAVIEADPIDCDTLGYTSCPMLIWMKDTIGANSIQWGKTRSNRFR